MSSVQMIDGAPKLVVDHEVLNNTFTEIYYYPDDALGTNQARYTNGGAWIDRTKTIIDNAAQIGVPYVLINLWWKDLDRSMTRPERIGDNLDYEPLDGVLDYAASKDIHVMLITMQHHFLPEWWKREKNFPDTHYDRSSRDEGSLCTGCETDSYGISYANMSDGFQEARDDYGKYLKALIDRYKAHPALIGWGYGLGPTGEDNYGPNYIFALGLGGHEPLPDLPLRITGYSPSYQSLFGEYLTEKYSTDSALQAAWSNSSVSLVDFEMPEPALLVNDVEGGLNMDAAKRGDVSGLTQAGQDFVEFRLYMRAQDTDYYASIFKENDPDHVLIFNGVGRTSLYEHELIDGIFYNPNLNYAKGSWGEFDQLYDNMNVVQEIVAYEKLPMAATEVTTVDDSDPIYQRQLNYMEYFGKSVKCFSGSMGYDTDLIPADVLERTLPTWYTADDMDVARSISLYVPGEDCRCSLVEELYALNDCEGHTDEHGERCRLIEHAYVDFCSGR